MKINLKKIKQQMLKKNFYLRISLLVLSIALLALNYNLFLAPNNYVIGGTSGLAIIIEKITGLNTSVFISITSFGLILLSFLILGKKDTIKSMIGAILYPLFVTATAPLAQFILPYLELDNALIVVLMAGIFCGISNGLIYKTGFNTGGSDIIMKIINKFCKIPEGKAIFSINLFIILLGLMTFGINKFIYSLIILFINTTLIDRILIGISNSKLFFIYTKEDELIKEFIIKELKTGVTILNARGGYTEEKNHVLMCVVANRDYYYIKEMVLKIDPHAFFIINDCYEVTGGVKRHNLPFE